MGCRKTRDRLQPGRKRIPKRGTPKQGDLDLRDTKGNKEGIGWKNSMPKLKRRPGDDSPRLGASFNWRRTRKVRVDQKNTGQERVGERARPLSKRKKSEGRGYKSQTKRTSHTQIGGGITVTHNRKNVAGGRVDR